VKHKTHLLLHSDLDDDAGRVFAREKSPLEVIRRDITAAGSNLGAQVFFFLQTPFPSCVAPYY